MNLSQSNNYAAEFVKQLKKSHAHLTTEEVILLCGWIGVSSLIQSVKKGPIRYALNIMAELIYTSLLNESEFAEYQTELKRKEDERTNAESRSKENQTVSEEEIAVEGSGASDRHSNEEQDTSVKDSDTSSESIKG